MDFVEYPKRTLRVDWTGRFLEFQRKTGEVVRVYFRRLNSKNDWFKYCCAIAVVQEYCTRDGQDGGWRGVEDTLASKIVERFRWSMKPSTRSQYWSHYFPCGEKAQTPLTEVEVLKPGGAVEQKSAKDVFSRLDGYVLGEPEKQADAKHEFWRIEFVNQDEEYDWFQTAVLQLIGAGVPTRREPDLAEQVLSYLEKLEEDCAELPYYFPDHLRREGESAFDKIRQTVRVIEDRKAFDKWLAEERERLRRAGTDPEGLSYGPNRGLPGEMDESYGHGLSPAVIAWDEQAGRRFHQVTILGDPGFGKSWLLRYEARRLAERAIEVLTNGGGGVDDIDLPILMRLPDLGHRKGTFEDIIVTRLRQKHSGSLGDYVRTRIASGHVILLLDAWDEIGDPDARRKLRDKIHDCQLRSRVLLTSRVVGYNLTPPPLRDGKEVELVAWKWEQIQSFVQVWFGSEVQSANLFLTKLKKHPQFRGLARIPLMLMLLCRAYPDGEFPERRSDVYEECLWGLLRDWQIYDKGCSLGYTAAQYSDTYVVALIEILQDLALELQEKGFQQFSAEDVRLIIEPFLNSLYQNRPSHEFRKEQVTCTDLMQRFKDDGVLISATSDGQEMRFLHLTFQEYLAARALAKKPDCVEKALKHIYNPAWNQVLVMLGSILEEPGPYIAALLRKNREDVLCRPFLLAVQALGEAWRGRVPKALRDGLTDELVRIRMHEETGFLCELVDHAVWHLSDAVVRLRDMIHSDRELTHAAVHMLGIIGSDEAIQVLLGLLRDEESYIRLAAITALGWNGSEKAVPALREALGDSDVDISWRAAEALGKIKSRDAVSALCEATQDPRERIRIVAAWGLGNIASKEAIPVLMEMMQDITSRVSSVAMVALGRIGSNEAVPALLQVLHDEDRNVRHVAAITLGRMGREEAIPDLLMMLDSEEEKLRYAAVWAMVQIGSEKAVPPLLEAMLDKDQRIRKQAAWGLGRIPSKQALPALLQAMQDEHKDVRIEVVVALGAIRSKAAIPALLQAMQDEDADIRYVAVVALGRSGSEGTLSALRQALQDENRNIRYAAAIALGRIGSEQAVPILLEAIWDKDMNVSENAVQALWNTGSKQAVTALLQMLGGGSLQVRRVAARALLRTPSNQPLPVLIQATEGHTDSSTHQILVAIRHHLQSVATSLDRLADLCENPQKRE